MQENYSYPFNQEWTNEELLIVMELWQAVESVYEKGLARTDFLKKYQAFKQIVKSIGEERQLSRDFEAVSGYSLYKVVQQANQSKKVLLKMEG